MEVFIIKLVLLGLNIMTVFLHSVGAYALISVYNKCTHKPQRVYLINLAIVEAAINMVEIISNFPDFFTRSKSILQIQEHLKILAFMGLSIVYYADMIYLTLDRLVNILLGLKYPQYWTAVRAQCLLITTWCLGGVCYFVVSVLYHQHNHSWPLIERHLYLYCYPPIEAFYVVLAFITYVLIFRKYTRSQERINSMANTHKRVDRNTLNTTMSDERVDRSEKKYRSNNNRRDRKYNSNNRDEKKSSNISNSSLNNNNTKSSNVNNDFIANSNKKNSNNSNNSYNINNNDNESDTNSNISNFNNNDNNNNHKNSNNKNINNKNKFWDICKNRWWEFRRSFFFTPVMLISTFLMFMVTPDVVYLFIIVLRVPEKDINDPKYDGIRYGCMASYCVSNLVDAFILVYFLKDVRIFLLSKFHFYRRRRPSQHSIELMVVGQKRRRQDPISRTSETSGRTRKNGLGL